MSVGPPERLAVTGGETVGLSRVGEVPDGNLTAVLVGSGGCFVFDLVLVLLLTALFSSSDEMSTTIWADIRGCSLFARLRIKLLSDKKRTQAKAGSRSC